VLKSLIAQLEQSVALTEKQIGEAVLELIDADVAPQTKADFLAALARKGETPDEIAAFARELRSRSIEPSIDSLLRAREIVDVCGTGGDHLKTFNISTTVGFVVAAAGVPVAKHGNRATTSEAGSADVLEPLGIRIDLSPEQAAKSLLDHNFAFFFAPQYHPAFKNIAPARKLCAEKKQRTIFNFLGPLLNPARPSAQLSGVAQPRLCEPIARVLQSLGARRGMVVCGCVEGSTCFLDELSTLGETTVAEFYQDRGFSSSMFKYGNLPLQRVTLAELSGGNAEANAEIIKQILDGKDRGPKRDVVLLNSAAALLVSGAAKNITAGWEMAADLIDSGKARKRLEAIAAANKER